MFALLALLVISRFINPSSTQADSRFEQICNSTSFLPLFPATDRDNTAAEIQDVLDRINATISTNQPTISDPPKTVNGTEITVAIELQIVRVTEIEVDASTFEIDAQLTEVWFDRRLATDGATNVLFKLFDDNVRNIWTPRTLYENAYKGIDTTNFTSSRTFAVVSNTGFVAKRSRGKVGLRCHMNLGTFPYDSHRCFIRLKAIQQIEYREFFYKACSNRSLQIMTELAPEEFVVSLRHIDNNCSPVSTIERLEIGVNGKLECVEMEIQFTRKSVWYAFFKALPSVCLVFFSFTTFLVPIHQHTARLSFILIPLSWFIYSNRNLVGKDYVVAANVWYFGCTVYVACVLVEYFVAFHSVQRIRTAVEERRKTYKAFVTGTDRDDPEATEEPSKSAQSQTQSETSSVQSSYVQSTQQLQRDTVGQNLANQDETPASSALFNSSPTGSIAHGESAASSNYSTPAISAPTSSVVALSAVPKSRTIEEAREATRATRRAKRVKPLPGLERLRLIWNFSHLPADKCARIAFPIGFVLFIYFYVLIYVI